MNMNTLYIMLGFIFLYAMISSARDKIKKRDEKSAALRKAYFLNGKDAKKLIEIVKRSKGI